ncbi:MAG: ADYC domain-containing protein [Polyangia bacterium]
MKLQPVGRVLPLFLFVGCGAPLDVGTAEQALVTQNGRMQNGRMQNGAALSIATVDLTQMRRLINLPAAGADPDISAANTVALPNVRLVGSTLTDGAVGTSFAGTTAPATFSNTDDPSAPAVAGDIYIDAVAGTSEPDVTHYTIRGHHPFVPAAGDTCGTDGCTPIWEYVCGMIPGRIVIYPGTTAATARTDAWRYMVPQTATATGGYWDYRQGVEGGGKKLLEQGGAGYDTHVTFACSDGAIGKCIEKMHYKPWALAARECAGSGIYYHCMQPTQELLHEACVRMVRADYCGDGQDHTVNGMAIDVWDQSHIQNETPYARNDAPNGVPYGHEGEWTANGARCVSNILMTRVSHIGAQNGETVGSYLMSSHHYCINKWSNQANEIAYKGPSSFNWADGDCFGLDSDYTPPRPGSLAVSAHSTYAFANVPWWWPIIQQYGVATNLGLGGIGLANGPAMDLHDRVLIKNKAVCIDDSLQNSSAVNYNTDKYLQPWCASCLQDSGVNTLCPQPGNSL